MDEERVSNPALLGPAVDFHHLEVAKWPLREQPFWLLLGRVFAREMPAFDVLSRSPGGGETQREAC
jgi:hypothetical protein